MLHDTFGPRFARQAGTGTLIIAFGTNPSSPLESHKGYAQLVYPFRVSRSFVTDICYMIRSDVHKSRRDWYIDHISQKNVLQSV